MRTFTWHDCKRLWTLIFKTEGPCPSMFMALNPQNKMYHDAEHDGTQFGIDWGAARFSWMPEQDSIPVSRPSLSRGPCRQLKDQCTALELFTSKLHRPSKTCRTECPGSFQQSAKRRTKRNCWWIWKLETMHLCSGCAPPDHRLSCYDDLAAGGKPELEDSCFRNFVLFQIKGPLGSFLHMEDFSTPRSSTWKI